jgi:hypothetical protein
MSHSKPLGAALVVLLAACASAEDLQKTQESWQGAAYEEVLRAWGAPARSTKTPDGRDWHTWVNEAYSQSSSFGVGVGGANVGRHGGVGVGMGMPIGNAEPPTRCERTLVFTDGKVVEQHWNGPAGFCSGFRSPPR